jgi:hypothetical protein
MKKLLSSIVLALCAVTVAVGQDKDTLEVQKIGNKYYVIIDHPKPDSSTSAYALPVSRKFDSHFMVAGLATVGFLNTWATTQVNTPAGIIKSKLPVSNSFGDVAHFEFSPMFIWRHGTNLLVEFEPSFNNGGLGVNWAAISYFAYPGVIIRAGYLTLPFGTYTKRLAAGWICKLATDPIGITSSPVGSDWGIEIEGGLPAGNMKVNYDVALTNGFIHSGVDGSIANPGLNPVDNNLGKTVTGRFGLLPWSNSSVEIGLSGLYGKAGDANTLYKNISTYMGALDFQWTYSKNPVVINIKGQYNLAYVTRANYINPTDSTQMYTYQNLSMGYYGLFAIRPVVSNKILRNLELAIRYSAFNTPKNSTFENHIGQLSIGLDYWLNWRTVFKITYENLITTNLDNQALGITNLKTVQNILYAQFSVQF